MRVKFIEGGTQSANDSVRQFQSLWTYERLMMISDDVAVRNAIPGFSQDRILEAASGSADGQFNSKTPSDILAPQNTVVGGNPDSLADLSNRQHDMSGRNEIDLVARREVERRLRATSVAEFHDANCDIQEGILVLSGNVANFHTKQLAQEIARKVDGVNFIVNRLRVDQSYLSAALRTDVPFHSIGTVD